MTEPTSDSGKEHAADALNTRVPLELRDLDNDLAVRIYDDIVQHIDVEAAETIEDSTTTFGKQARFVLKDEQLVEVVRLHSNGGTKQETSDVLIRFLHNL